MMTNVCPTCYKEVDISCTCKQCMKRTKHKKLMLNAEQTTETCPYCGAEEEAGFYASQEIDIFIAIQGGKGFVDAGEKHEKRLEARKKARYPKVVIDTWDTPEEDEAWKDL